MGWRQAGYARGHAAQPPHYFDKVINVHGLARVPHALAARAPKIADRMVGKLAKFFFTAQPENTIDTNARLETLSNPNLMR